MNALKAIVIIMGVLILIGSVVVVVTIFNRLTSGGDGEGETPTAAEAVAPRAFGTRDLDLPAGTRIIDLDEGGGRLYLQALLPGGEKRILVVDPDSGETLGTLRIPAPP
ncbi:MAG: hypothetical protein GY791_05095 [Alphaproteobacteria bacterium]|nr:hypothetical protein [Alphaproteobacteria bacterium]